MQDIINNLLEYVAKYGLNLLAAIVILIVGKWVAKIVANFSEKICEKVKVEKTLGSFVKNITFFTLMVFVVIAALNKLGVETTSLVAIIGAAGLAVGLALQGSLANFAAGIILILFKPFKVGDLIEAGGALGTVVEIQIFNTLLNTLDNRRVIIPNSNITGGNITNYTSLKKRRVDLVFGISYNDNIKTAKEALEAVLAANEKVLKNPAPTIAVSELGDSSVNIVCRPWVKPVDYWDVYFNTLEKGKLELEKRGITIPFPQRDVHLYKEPAE